MAADVFPAWEPVKRAWLNNPRGQCSPMQHQLGSSEGSISLQKDGEELHWESCEPAASSSTAGMGRGRKGASRCGGRHRGRAGYLVYMLCRCIQVSSVRLLITLEPFKSLCSSSSRGNSFHCFLLFGEAGQRWREKGKGDDSDAPLACYSPHSFSSFPSLPLLSFALYKGMFNT